jgi:tRNA dimethylallyltransferase
VSVVVAVVGATATGKSGLAVELALRLGGEVINTDAMQLYQGMEIGTAKLTLSQRRGVPHHLLDELAVTQEASLAAYQRRARQIRDEILARGGVPVLAGGSGLYVRAALDQLEIPPTDPVVRAALQAEGERAGSAVLHARLAQADPAAAAAILPSNLRRVVRALEVIEVTGRPFTATLPVPRYDRPAVQIGLIAPRPVLDQRIHDRVGQMWADGLVDETRELAARGLRQGRTASRALGYAQVLRMLDGDLDEEQARAGTAAATRRFARRQESWFRRDQRVHWLAHDRAELVEAALEIVRSARTLPW